MSAMDERYDPAAVEARWQVRWEKDSTFAVDDRAAGDRTYVLEMFPYPSGRIHIGHVRNYAIGDVIARYTRMRGLAVLHPMGWDAFGLPAENAAIQSGEHPAKWTYRNIDVMRAQLRRMGLSYDWRREFATCDPSYYRWEQQIFLEMFEKGLAYRRHAPANWCPSCQTVLANEQVEDGLCWRCGSKVELRALEQWFFRITAYAEELLEGCDRLAGGWPERVLSMQRNWIGKSVGAEVRFGLLDPRPAGTADITVFTTRPDTLFGATFMSLAVEHPLVLEFARAAGREREVAAFVDKVKKQPREERAAGKEGVFIGGYCENPMTRARMPIYAANFVLMEYGTGAVMAVPAHDQRDFEFARRYDLPMIVVIEPEGTTLDSARMSEAYEGPGRMVRSGSFDGLPSEEGKRAVAEHLKTRGLGGPTIQYRLRDWCISRQRYWGAPIPILYCERCGVVPVPVKDLPVVLPLDVPLTGEGGSPLAKSESFVRASCPRCGGSARRETDTMDTFVESSWYFARFICPDDVTRPLDRERVDRWLPVDQYVGGIEHAVLHLIYSRFYTRVLRDLGYVGVDEPFANLLTQGMVCKETLRCEEHGWLLPEEDEGGHCTFCGRPVEIGRIEKMSKSKKNVVDPDDLIRHYGADTVRLFCLFAAPVERDLEWSDQGVEGASRFLHRLWRIVHSSRERIGSPASAPDLGELGGRPLALYRHAERAVRKAGQDIGERFHFNTAIAATMELVNATSKFLEERGTEENGGPAALRHALRSVVLLLAPVVPHVCAELWQALGYATGLDSERWPEADEQALIEETVTVVVQVNGKLRARLAVPRGSAEETVVAAALGEDGVRRHVDGRAIRKRVFVADKLLNLVVD
jgi:leucyl-tRNA synthetase